MVLGGAHTEDLYNATRKYQGRSASKMSVNNTPLILASSLVSFVLKPETCARTYKQHVLDAPDFENTLYCPSFLYSWLILLKTTTTKYYVPVFFCEAEIGSGVMVVESDGDDRCVMMTEC